MFSKLVKKSLSVLALSAGALTLTLAPAAAEFPEKPVTLVIPLGAGGSHDLNARIITSVIPTYLEQAMIVRLTPGAGGQKGTQEVANADADGYTLLFSHNYMDMLQQYVDNLPYDPMEDFIPIARVNYAPASIIVRADSPYETFEDLVEDARARPGELSIGHSGNWGAFFVPAAQIMQQLGLNMNLVPYQGGGPAMQALLSGDSDFTMAFPSAIGALRDAGDIRVLASAGEERLYEDVPTLAEVGVTGDIGYMHRFILAPAGTPDDVVATLSDAFESLSTDPTFVRLMGSLGESIDPMTGPEYQELREQQAVAYEALVDTLTSQ
ncbi:Tripartite-type tricarboxylate transporter, receptor component TctC [Monaibacterium marinum]|uniref:Tripartite-type tricarboxylate transporter, receptor component TctC n=1 Tax=Pontivivens marinum TaxID=1690039 RepID=A0A2C9CUN3_9RHOB|nr:tripartite tricarboxylate transporter substrate binding protein [Monaibacterium marinum]SOH94920.1 Tripartite-type tricarboxylate transporter, receptor component TctC [Monaibacterium marinum]